LLQAEKITIKRAALREIRHCNSDFESIQTFPTRSCNHDQLVPLSVRILHQGGRDSLAVSALKSRRWITVLFETLDESRLIGIKKREETNAGCFLHRCRPSVICLRNGKKFYLGVTQRVTNHRILAECRSR